MAEIYNTFPNRLVEGTSADDSIDNNAINVTISAGWSAKKF